MAETDPRIRLSSVEPMDWGDELLGLMAADRASPAIHMPLQSGSTRC
jgi:tRNA A37 methylthiotransferase MiaB